jgi:hypothetical protein
VWFENIVFMKGGKYNNDLGEHTLVQGLTVIAQHETDPR